MTPASSNGYGRHQSIEGYWHIYLVLLVICVGISNDLPNIRSFAVFLCNYLYIPSEEELA